jgi:Trk K+ transport system NAD-binding subunit
MGGRNRLAVYRAYGLFLLREFRWPLGIFFGLILGGGLLIHLGHDVPHSFGEGCYRVFTMLFLEPGDPFPQAWYLEALYYLAPVLGVFVIADSLVLFGLLVFRRKSRLKEWWVMEASTYRTQVVGGGGGRVGYRVISELRRLGELVVGIERQPEPYLTAELQDAGVPIIVAEARLRSALVQANVKEAAAIICATNDDLANLDIALTAREIRPDIRVVLRIFDDTLAQKFATVFKMPAVSTSQTGAHVFVAAATGRGVYYSFQVDRSQLQIADLRVARLAGRTIAELETQEGLRVMCHSSGGTLDLRPRPDRALKSEDTIVVMARGEQLRQLEALNR